MGNDTDNREWIRRMVEAHEKSLCRYAYSLCGSVTAAQDAVQDTFLRLCRADRGRIEGHEAAWLFRVCRSRVFDMKRKEKPVQPLTPSHEAALADRGQTPAESAARHDAEQQLPKLLGLLPEKQRDVIRLKFQQNLSYREIAGIMKLSESNVGYLIHMGIKALRDHAKTTTGDLS